MTDRRHDGTAGAWHVGNAVADGANTRGWILGHFLDETCGVRSTTAVEVKWAHHTAGTRRSTIVTGETRTTLLLLIEGRYRLDVSQGSALLTEPGDYVLWGPGVDHQWSAEHDSTIVTVRWPSVPTDAEGLPRG